MTYSTLTPPPIQEQICARWLPERGQQVSICMLTYNHAPYLRDALNAILNQKTDFGFEILVHDDASTDDTQFIIREYESRYPAIVKPIYQSVNQYSQDINPAVRYNYPRANSPFVAICEGDDYWTDEYKLQTQVDLLLSSPNINLIFHQAHRIHCIDPDAAPSIIGDYAEQDSFIPFNDILFRTRGMVPTASCMIRQQAKERLLDFMRSRPYLTLGDLYFQFFSTEPNGALYIARPMSLYRYGTEYSWSRRVIDDFSYRVRHERAMIRSYIELDELTHGVHHSKFVALTLQRLIWLFNPVRTDGSSPSPILSDTVLPEPLIQKEELESLAFLYRNCQARILNKLDEWRDFSRPRVVFGAASGCRIILDALGPDNIAAIVDRDNRRIGETLRDIPVISTSQLNRYANAELLVSTPSADHSSMMAITGTAGIPPSRVHYLFDSARQWLETHPVSQEFLFPRQ